MFSSSLILSGLYDQPVVIEGKRERKTTVFLANQTTPQVVKTAKPLVFEVSLIDIFSFNSCLNNILLLTDSFVN